MSELYADDPFLRALEEATGGGAAKPFAELTDPATGKKVPFESAEKLQEAVQLMYNANLEAQAQAREAQAKLAAVPAKPEPKPKPAAKPDSEKLLSEFQKRTELDAVDGMDYFTSNLPTVQKLNETIAALQQRQAQFEQALTATTFLGTNREVAQSPEAQKAVGEILTAMGIANPTPQHYNIALAAAKSTAPQLFQQAQQGTPAQGGGVVSAPSGGFRESFTPAPSPPRTSTAGPSGPSAEAAIERQIDQLWSQPGGEAKVLELLNQLAARG